MNKKGLTLLELIGGVVAAGAVAIVAAALFKAGIRSYTYTMRQNSALSSAYKALDGLGSTQGMLWKARASNRVSSLSSSSLVAVSTGGITTTFSRTGTNLYSGSTLLATGVSTMTVNYYSINSTTGLIFTSTSANDVGMITVSLTFSGYGAGDKSYNFFGGARLRNTNN